MHMCRYYNLVPHKFLFRTFLLVINRINVSKLILILMQCNSKHCIRCIWELKRIFPPRVCDYYPINANHNY